MSETATPTAIASAATMVLLSIGVLASVRQPLTRSAPPPLPRNAAAPWMADCLPGIGAKRREHIAELLRAGRSDDLTPRARAVAATWFIP